MDIGYYFLTYGSDSSGGKKSKSIRNLFSQVFTPRGHRTESKKKKEKDKKGKKKDDGKTESLKTNETSQSSMGTRPRLSKEMQPLIKPQIPIETKSITSGKSAGLSKAMIPLSVAGSETNKQPDEVPSGETGQFSKFMQPEGSKMVNAKKRVAKKSVENIRKDKNPG